MDAVSLDSTGCRMSEQALGPWRFGRVDDARITEIESERAVALLDTHADRGGRYIDTAEMYGVGQAERCIGVWLRTHDRDSVVASTVSPAWTSSPSSARVPGRV
jgi:aryl-alcohol dehydrogenase-like predicted oxidoreductase